LTFNYWNADHANSPAPEVVLTFNGDHPVVAEDVMRKEPPSQQERTKTLEEIRAAWADKNLGIHQEKVVWKAPPTLWKHMLDLIYTGNDAEAWRLVDETWPTDRPNKDASLKSFKNQLATSPYWDRIRKLNRIE
jgi:hypothetical protein